jgi:hypothetical protein
VEKRGRGFASMDPEKQRSIASKGGKAAHEKGSSGNRSCAFRIERPRTLRSSITACRHHRSVREPARPTSIRVAWNRERCVLLFASHASVDLAPGASLCVRRQGAPSSLPARPAAFAADRGC